MILTGPAIEGAFLRGEIEIDPFDSAQLNPASYDLRLGDKVAVYTPGEVDMSNDLRSEWCPAPKGLLDSKARQSCTLLTLSEQGFTVHPGRLYLMHTRERLHTKRFVTVIDGKSSIGRLGVMVHITAGYGDPGFDGQYTLEVVSLAHPVVLYPGMRIAQARFQTLLGEHEDYRERGNYTSADARGPVRSASWKQFK